MLPWLDSHVVDSNNNKFSSPQRYIQAVSVKGLRSLNYPTPKKPRCVNRRRDETWRIMGTCAAPRETGGGPKSCMAGWLAGWTNPLFL